MYLNSKLVPKPLSSVSSVCGALPSFTLSLAPLSLQYARDENSISQTILLAGGARGVRRFPELPTMVPELETVVGVSPVNSEKILFYLRPHVKINEM